MLALCRRAGYCGGVRTLTIRDVPDSLHAALKERARRNRRSVNQQVLAELSCAQWVETGDERMARVEREIRQAGELRGRAGGFFSADEIDAAKGRGRE